MGVKFQILPDRNLVYVSYSGTAIIADTAHTFGAYVAHPDFKPGQNQLVDMTHITGYEADFGRLFDLQMRKAAVFVKDNQQVLMVYYAPHGTAVKVAQYAVRSWDGVHGTCPRIVSTSEADALHLLGEPERSFSRLLHGRRAAQSAAR
jgi:hypothetical protein